MTNDLRAAAERLRRVLQGESLHGIYGSGPVPRSQETRFQRDCEDLARAYLASHPPDGETEIDEAWLVSVGFQWIDNKAMELESAECALWWSKESETVRIYAKGSAPGDYIDTATETRGQLRGLCAALGISLKEEKEA